MSCYQLKVFLKSFFVFNKLHFSISDILIVQLFNKNIVLKKIIIYVAVVVLFSTTIQCGSYSGNELVFSESDVPISIPFAGNTYVTEPANSGFIDNYSGKIKTDWVDKDIVMSTFFRVGGSGELKIGFIGSNSSGSSKIRFIIEGNSYDVEISGDSTQLYNIAKINKSEPGYVKVDFRGLSKEGSTFGEIYHFRLGGEAAEHTNNFVSEEKMSENKNNCYFFRRGASVHYFYSFPSEDVKYFYNEIVVPEESAVNNTYYMMNGFSEGYMGIQQTSSGERKVLFSVWSPFVTDNPNEIPENKRVKHLRKGKDVTVGEFGNEGSGGQSWLHYSWEPGVTYKALVGVEPDGRGSTVYTAYFYADDEWKLIASFSRPDTDTYYSGAYSFLENFNPTHSIYTRSVYFKNQWVMLASGEWQEVLSAKFSMDNTGREGLRYDVYGEVDDVSNSFMLKSFGFFDEHGVYGSMHRRKPSKLGVPCVDIEALELIPSVN